MIHLQFWLYCVLISLALVGWGYLFLRLLGQRSCKDKLSTHLVCGLVSATALSQLTNLIIAMSDTLSITLLTTGAIVGLIQARHYRTSTNLVFLLTLLGASSFTLVSPLHPDAGLYHLPTIKWFKESAIPLGVANTQFQIGLGFHSIALLLSSMFWVESLQFSMFTLSPVIHALFLFVIWEKSFGHQRKQPLTKLFCLALLIFYLVFGKFIFLFGGTGSPSPDFIVTLLSFLSFIYFISAWESQSSTDHICLLFSISLAITTKISQAPLSLLLLPHYRVFLSKEKFALIAAGLLCFLWIIRSFLNSGCFVFPAVSTCFDVSWFVGDDMIQRLNNAIVAGGRMLPYKTERILLDFSWVKSWAQFHYTYHPFVQGLMRFIGLMAISTVALRILLRKNISDLPKRPILFCFATSLVGSLFWFFTSPYPRFGFTFLTITTMTPFFLFLPKITETRIYRVLGLSILTFGMIYFVTRPFLSFSGSHVGHFHWQSGYPQIPQAEVNQVQSNFGTVYYQLQKQAGTSGQCYLAPLPCTTQTLPNLHLKTFGRWKIYGSKAQEDHNKETL